MTTQEAKPWPCNTQVKIVKVGSVQGNKGPQWELTCEFPWIGPRHIPEIVWMNKQDGFEPEPGNTYAVVVNRRDFKTKDETKRETEYYWSHWINGFTHDPNLEHFQAYSATSSQSPSAAPQGDSRPASGVVPSRTINDLPGAEIGAMENRANDIGIALGIAGNIDEMKSVLMNQAYLGSWFKAQFVPLVNEGPVPEDEPVWNQPESRPSWENDEPPDDQQQEEELRH